MRNVLAAGVLAAMIPVFAAAQSTSPYAGQELRDLKTLSADEQRGYLNGEGLGMAKAGELNHYPGPKHVLDVAGHLTLSAEQKRRIEAILSAMSGAAVPLGVRIVAAERALDQAFANCTIDDEKLCAQTVRIGELQGQLRAVHLSAHLATRAVLTPEQIAAYDEMRGYGSRTGSGAHHHGS